jgi:hypothetical protein
MLRLAAPFFVAGGLVVATACSTSSTNDDTNSTNSSCESFHECTNGICECTTPGLEGTSCNEDSCESQCEVCTS